MDENVHRYAVRGEGEIQRQTKKRQREWEREKKIGHKKMTEKAFPSIS